MVAGGDERRDGEVFNLNPVRKSIRQISFNSRGVEVEMKFPSLAFKNIQKKKRF